MLAVALGLVFALSGCARQVAIPPWMEPPEGLCHLPVVKLTANQFDDPDEASGRPDSPDVREFIRTLGDGLRSASPLKAENDSKSVLVLSGGSLHGAFGAGLFYGWAKAAGEGGEQPPTYDIITGVSTGALQSTFIFLATSKSDKIKNSATSIRNRLGDVPFLRDRLYHEKNGVAGPETGYLATLAQDYMPDRESDLLHLHPLQKLSPNKLGFLELINHDGLANMDPLRRVIRAELSDDALRGVATEANSGRRLYVAIADLENKYGYAADLTKLAQLAVLAAEPGAKTPEEIQDLEGVFPEYRRSHPHSEAIYLEWARDCYTDALVASSSVPPGVNAVPIEIIKEGKDGHILDPNSPRLRAARGLPKQVVPSNYVAGRHVFVDGGALFAVFFSQLHDEIKDLPKVDMDLIVNGTYFPKEWDKWLDSHGKTKRIEKMRLSSVDYGLGAADLLQTQVRIFSVQEARRWESGRGTFRWALIDNRAIVGTPDGMDKFFHWPGKRYEGTPFDWGFATAKGSGSCQHWHDTVDRKMNPMEFYPVYMQCMLDYGITRGADPKRRWNMCLSADQRNCGALASIADEATPRASSAE